jgi:deoxyribose-phosphate aldolase
MNPTVDDIAGMIDHSFLKPTMTIDELERGCHEAVELNVASVCLLPFYVPRCAMILSGTRVKTSTTIGFPHGGHTTAVKIFESKTALDQGCQELDMVVNINWVLSGEFQKVEYEIGEIVRVTHAAGQKLKVIFENCYLNDEQKIRLCQICGNLNVDWVKTSTGFGTSGATLDDLVLMRRNSPEHVQVKASGGIGDLDTVLKFREAGVTRIGSSRTRQILGDFRHRFGAS